MPEKDEISTKIHQPPGVELTGGLRIRGFEALPEEWMSRSVLVNKNLGGGWYYFAISFQIMETKGDSGASMTEISELSLPPKPRNSSFDVSE